MIDAKLAEHQKREDRDKMFLCNISWGSHDPCWDDNGIIEILTLKKLEMVIEKFEKQHQDNKATIVDVMIPSGDSLTIALGRSKTFLMCIPRKESCLPACRSLGEDNEMTRNEVVAFWYSNTWSEYQKCYLIPTELGKRAIKYFVETGKLLEEITWKKCTDM